MHGPTLLTTALVAATATASGPLPTVARPMPINAANSVDRPGPLPNMVMGSKLGAASASNPNANIELDPPFGVAGTHPSPNLAMAHAKSSHTDNNDEHKPLPIEKQVGILCHDILHADKNYTIEYCSKEKDQEWKNMCFMENIIDQASKECVAILVKAFGGGGDIEVQG